MSFDDLIDIVKGGFGLPIISLLGSTITYVLIQMINQVMNAFGNLNTGSKFELFGYTTYVALFGIMIVLMAICGYFKDFTNGVEYPKHAVIYGVSALGGLIFFWNAIVGINIGGTGQDAIISTIITIILSFGGAAVSYHYFR